MDIDLGAWAPAAAGVHNSDEVFLTDERQQLLLRLLPAPATTDSNSSSNDEDRPRKLRRSTYATRKREAERMKTEVSQLTDLLGSLKRRDRGQDAANERDTELALALNANGYMRSLVRTNEQMLAGAHVALSDWMNDDPSVNSLTSFIHLTRDMQHRRDTLLAMKQEKLRMVDQYIKARNQQRNLFKPFETKTQSESDDGDLYCLHADIVQLKGAKSARQAYDALMVTMAHMEITVSEKLGDITVREDYDVMKEGVENYRMRSWEHRTAPQETNCAVFTHFYENQTYNESSDDQGYGVTVIDFVDQDDLHPYQSGEYLRRDVTTTSVISMHRDPKNDQELVVVIQRAGFAKIHRTDLAIDESVLDAMRKDMTTWCEVCLSSMRELIAAATLPVPPREFCECVAD